MFLLSLVFMLVCYVNTQVVGGEFFFGGQIHEYSKVQFIHFVS